MPERKITSFQEEHRVAEWAKIKGGKLVERLSAGLIPGSVYEVDGEPIVLGIQRVDQRTGEATSTILVSDKHAKELTDQGILGFEGF